MCTFSLPLYLQLIQSRICDEFGFFSYTQDNQQLIINVICLSLFSLPTIENWVGQPTGPVFLPSPWAFVAWPIGPGRPKLEALPINCA